MLPTFYNYSGTGEFSINARTFQELIKQLAVNEGRETQISINHKNLKHGNLYKPGCNDPE